jgi:hypothetical protein
VPVLFETATIPFTVDLTPPTVAIAAPTQGQVVPFADPLAFEFEGSAGDNNGIIAHLTLSVITPLGESTIAAMDNVSSWSRQVVLSSAIPRGTFHVSFIARAQDVVHLQGSAGAVVRVDGTPPNIAIATPAPLQVIERLDAVAGIRKAPSRRSRRSSCCCSAWSPRGWCACARSSATRTWPGSSPAGLLIVANRIKWRWQRESGRDIGG